MVFDLDNNSITQEIKRIILRIEEDKIQKQTVTEYWDFGLSSRDYAFSLIPDKKNYDSIQFEIVVNNTIRIQDKYFKTRESYLLMKNRKNNNYFLSFQVTPRNEYITDEILFYFSSYFYNSPLTFSSDKEVSLIQKELNREAVEFYYEISDVKNKSYDFRDYYFCLRMARIFEEQSIPYDSFFKILFIKDITLDVENISTLKRLIKFSDDKKITFESINLIELEFLF